MLLACLVFLLNFGLGVTYLLLGIYGPENVNFLVSALWFGAAIIWGVQIVHCRKTMR